MRRARWITAASARVCRIVSSSMRSRAELLPRPVLFRKPCLILCTPRSNMIEASTTSSRDAMHMFLFIRSVRRELSCTRCVGRAISQPAPASAVATSSKPWRSLESSRCEVGECGPPDPKSSHSLLVASGVTCPACSPSCTAKPQCCNSSSKLWRSHESSRCELDERAPPDPEYCESPRTWRAPPAPRAGRQSHRAALSTQRACPHNRPATSSCLSTDARWARACVWPGEGAHLSPPTTPRRVCPPCRRPTAL